jgi:pimeloyl-ACP methyl ester carboxylesterase
VPRFTGYRFAVTVLILLVTAPLLNAADGMVGERTGSPRYIVVGFVGGFVRHDNPHQGPVIFAQQARRKLPKNSFVRVFENRHRKTAYKTILRLLDGDHDGSLTQDEKTNAHIILFGHSWGASAVVLLARELDRAGVPVMLTVQVDSVAKPWQHDDVIPDNVEAAVNFYQPHGFVHGRSEIRAEDDSKTTIIGNYRFDYQDAPIKCEGTSWFDRAFMGDHMQSECDPRIWSQVDSLIQQRIQPRSSPLAVNSQQR